MDSMIRDTSQPVVKNRRRRSDIFWLVVLGAAVFACGGLAALNAAALGWQGLVFLAAIALVALFGFLSLMMSGGSDIFNETDADPSIDAFASAFMKSPEACLIMKDGKPYYANESYMTLARNIGAVGASDTPPTIDRLFVGAGKETASAVFRLHHMQEHNASAEEFISTLSPDGSVSRYRVHVTDLGNTQFWQISDATTKELGPETTLIGAPVGLFSVTSSGHVIATNAVLDRWLGTSKNRRPEMMREFIEDADTLLSSPTTPGRIVRADTRLITQKGVVTPTIMVGTWHELDNGEPFASVALYGHSSMGAPKFASTPAPITSPVKVENNKIGGNSFAASPVAIVQLQGADLSTAVIKEANPAFDQMSHGILWQEKPFRDIFEPNEDGNAFLKKKAQDCNSDEPFDARLTGDDGAPVNVYIVPDLDDPMSCWVYMVDVTARKNLERQLFQSQKLQAVGQLAGGVAHDFNNLLQAIRLNTDALLERHPVGDPSYLELQTINSTVIRSASIVKKLLAYSSKQTLQTEVLNISDTLSDVSVLLKQVLDDRVHLNVIHGRGLPSIRADKNELETVLVNLCVNARDAMAEQGGGSITIQSSSSSREDLVDKMLPEDLEQIKGEQIVVIEVSDTGTGMSEEVQAKIFEAYFTTKELGKGTGLGLATSYGIIQQSGGQLTVESELGIGTTFRIYLPVASIKASDAEVISKKAALQQPKKPSNLSGQGNILFVEDEVNVRDIAAKMLRKRGYNVTEAGDGEEAYDILEDGDQAFDLMISDVVMPGMDGPSLLKKGRALLGDSRIVFISGYAEEEFSDLLAEEPDVTFLPKPFTLTQLAEKVKSEIGDSDGDFDN